MLLSYHAQGLKTSRIFPNLWDFPEKPSPFAVPYKIFGLTPFLDFIDRSTHCALAVSATGGARARGLEEKVARRQA